MVTQQHLNVTLYVHQLSCYFQIQSYQQHAHMLTKLRGDKNILLAVLPTHDY